MAIQDSLLSQLLDGFPRNLRFFSYFRRGVLHEVRGFQGLAGARGIERCQAAPVSRKSCVRRAVINAAAPTSRV